MIREFKGNEPSIADSAYIDEGAVVIGDVEIGAETSVWPGVVIRGDGGLIRIGERTSIQDNTVIHVPPDGEADIGDECTVGHGAVIHGREVGDRVLVGMNSTILERAKVGDESIIAANSLVSEGMEVPERSFFAGTPGEIKKELTEDQVKVIKMASEHYVHLSKEHEG